VFTQDYKPQTLRTRLILFYCRMHGRLCHRLPPRFRWAKRLYFRGVAHRAKLISSTFGTDICRMFGGKKPLGVAE
jgi:hypothetical protein